MLSILLTILKYIFLTVMWIIVVLLITLLVLLCIILFVPIKYKVKASYFDDIFVSRSRVTWLFNIINISIAQDSNKTDIITRIFGFRLRKKVNNKETKEELKRNIKEKEEAYKETIKEEVREEVKRDLHIDEEVDTKYIKKECKLEKDIDNKSKVKAEKLKKKKVKKQKKPNKDLSLWEQIREKINKGKAFISDEKNKSAIKKIYNSIKRIFKKLAPNNIKLYLQIGTGDPALTGYVLGILSFLYIIKSKDINLEGNFDEKIIKGTIDIKGKIYLVTIVIEAIKLLIDKNVRRLVLSKNV
ncbi:DUF2953 family protein [Natranaerovirga pectinivora]|uniref:DUF2953 family protein n=1 Tax=Natranaerovirga pectinivora TaxID=682400 RepID=A0A4R3MT04_9FIRM|nr:DUF2953 domain-containing protein [Natranaerovirga pectinivora]TCT16840.1 DUF2953 family protein [Natranaerovirga pectinivora]